MNDRQADVQVRDDDGELTALATITAFDWEPGADEQSDVVDRAVDALRDEFGDDLVDARD